MTEYHVRVSPDFHARLKDLKLALERLDVAKGVTKNHPTNEEILVAMGQLLHFSPAPRTEREVRILAHVTLLLQAGSPLAAPSPDNLGNA